MSASLEQHAGSSSPAESALDSNANGQPTTSHDQADHENKPPKQRSASSSEESKTQASSTTSPGTNAGQPPALPKDDSFVLQTNGTSETWDKQRQDLATVEKPAQTEEAEKSKDTEDDWEKVSIPSMSAEKEKEKELKAAPLPPVNIWQQRREAQDAKKRVSSSQKPVAAATARAKPPLYNVNDTKSVSTGKDRSAGNKGLGGQRSAEQGPKPTDSKEQASVRLSRPNSQHNNASGGAVPPLVADSESWPTPDTVITDERRKSTTIDKSEKLDAKSNAQKPHGKWVQMPFVPTAKFETQLPTSVARRGGRGGNRGRDTTSRGGHLSHNVNNGEKGDNAGSMGPPPLPKQASEQDRGRKADGTRSARASSVPSTGRRHEGGDSAVTNARKFSAVPARDGATGIDSRAAQSSKNVTPVNDGSSGKDRASRSSSRHAGLEVKLAEQAESGMKDGKAPPQSDAATASMEPGNRPSYASDRHRGTGTGSPRGNGEVARERGYQKSRDWSKEKADTFREKVDSWRDRDSHGEPTGRRAERGRGGYRGRGNHNGFNNHYNPAHAFTSPLPQNGFENPRATPAHDSRARQASQPYTTSQGNGNSRNNPRSQSIPMGMVMPGYYPEMSGMSQNLSPTNAEMSVYGYQNQIPMPSGLMSAMPYNEPLNSYAVISLVMRQIEYYFSVDNLCKDMFLRKHMDSQGYVPLHVIASFRRIKTLVDDNTAYDTLRFVCQQLKSIELLSGGQGEDYIRRRENWTDFVLPMNERIKDAQHEGPTIRLQQVSSPVTGEVPLSGDVNAVNAHMRSPPPSFGVFGADHVAKPPMHFDPTATFESHAGRSTETSIAGNQAQMKTSPTTSPMSHDRTAMQLPVRQGSVSGPLNTTPNGHRHQSVDGSAGDVFPDERVPEVTIVCKLGEVGDVSREPSTNGVAGEYDHAPNGDAKVSGLRGGEVTQSE